MTHDTQKVCFMVYMCLCARRVGARFKFDLFTGYNKNKQKTTQSIIFNCNGWLILITSSSLPSFVLNSDVALAYFSSALLNISVFFLNKESYQNLNIKMIKCSRIQKFEKFCLSYLYHSSKPDVEFFAEYETASVQLIYGRPME